MPPQFTLIRPLNLSTGNPGIFKMYSVGQYRDSRLAYDHYARSHMLNGQPDPLGTPLTNPGKVTWGMPPPSTWQWPDPVPPGEQLLGKFASAAAAQAAISQHFGQHARSSTAST
jgi:hypothetical protein